VSERPFLELAATPDAARLEAVLGPVIVFYRDLTGLCHAFRQTWSHTKSSGWMLKVADSKKALCYVIPLSDSFRVSMAIRESERATFLDSESMADYRDVLMSARRFAEGYSIAFDVTDATSHDRCCGFIRQIIEARGMS